MQTHRAHRRLGPASGTFLTATFAAATAYAGVAQPAPSFDHLHCYRVAYKSPIEVDGRIFDPLTLTPSQVPPFELQAGCRFQPAKNPRPTHVCIPTDKQPRLSEPGNQLTSDYFLYRLRCEAQPDIASEMYDQFVRGPIGIRRKTTTTFLLVPAYQVETPESSCGPVAPGQCGGACPDSGQSCLPGPAGVCGCFDQAPCGGDPIGGQCNGICAPGEICAVDQLGKCSCLR